MNTLTWIDITTLIENDMVHWPGDEPVEVKRSSSIDAGDLANVTSISMSAHTATHLDAPLHFLNDGKDITQLSLDILIGRAKVFHILDKKCISLKEIKKHAIEKGDRILFKTFNSSIDWPMKDFRKDYIYLDKEAAEFLKEKGV